MMLATTFLLLTGYILVQSH